MSNRNNSSPGYMYFQNEADTSDFLSFNNSPSHESPKQYFSPSNYSSPKYKGTPRKFNMKSTYRYSSGNISSRSSNSFESSPRSNNSYRGKPNNRSRGFHRNSSGRDISTFIDRDCLKDPWKELEEILKSKEKIETSLKEEIDDSKKESSEDSTSEEDEGSSSTGDGAT